MMYMYEIYRHECEECGCEWQEKPKVTLENTDADAWAVEKDGGEFDQFTGATITPRAVVEAVHAALHAFEAHQDRLLDPRAGEQRTADGATEETDDG